MAHFCSHRCPIPYLADTGALIREAETETDQYGQKITRVYIGLTDAIKQPDQIIPPLPRNHSGLRSYCPSCGSENLLEEKKIICTDCGTVVNATRKLVNQDPTEAKSDLAEGQDDPRIQDPHDQHIAMEQKTTLREIQPVDNLTPFLKPKEPTDILTPGLEKPAAPPCPPVGKPAFSEVKSASVKGSGEARPDIITWHEMKEQTPQAQETERDLEQAAHLLLDIAGDEASHISMPGENGKKYTTVHRALNLTDMQLHLRGTKTLGGRLTHQDATTRALCFDADDPKSLQNVKNAAAVLIAYGYKPLIEPSPAGRGGHLWLIFSDRVNARRAYHEVCELAPDLQEVTEHWPNRGNQKVRLPAGKYVTPTHSSWTHLTDAKNNTLATTGAEAAAILLSNLTPAGVIPPQANTDERDPTEAPKLERKTNKPPRRSAPEAPDEQHKRKYGKHEMWVEWQSEEYLIERFNEQYTIDDLAARERNNMINAATIGRPERTASVGVTKDGQRFTDFGAGATQPDGHQDGGDPFEFYIRSQRLDKKDVLRQLGQALNKEASSELLRAARAGELPPAWVMDILTDTGRAVYNENAQKHGHKPLEEHTCLPAGKTRGVVGFSMPEMEQQPQEEQAEPKALEIAAKRPTFLPQSEAPYPPPQRPCICCGVVAWKWTGEKYICANPGHGKK